MTPKGMTSSALVERYKAELEALIERGGDLEMAMMIHYRPDLVPNVTPDLKKSLPNPAVAYQAWYSEALVLIQQLLPARSVDFRGYYESPKNRKELDVANYRIADALNGLEKGADRWGNGRVAQDAAIPHIQQQNAIVKGLRTRLESSLYDLRLLLQADLFDNELEVAKELLRKGFNRAAGAIAGVVLEGHLKEVCANHTIKTTAKATISTVNDLLKEANIIDQAQWRFHQHLTDIRNLCDHKDSSSPESPSHEQATDLIAGVTKVLKTIV